MTNPNDESTRHLGLGEGREFDTIRDFIKRWGDAATGIGDDAATLELPRGEKLIVSVG